MFFCSWYKLPSINHYKTFQALEAVIEETSGLPGHSCHHFCRAPGPWDWDEIVHCDLDQFSSLCWPRSMYAKTGKASLKSSCIQHIHQPSFLYSASPQLTCPLRSSLHFRLWSRTLSLTSSLNFCALMCPKWYLVVNVHLDDLCVCTLSSGVAFCTGAYF